MNNARLGFNIIDLSYLIVIFVIPFLLINVVDHRFGIDSIYVYPYAFIFSILSLFVINSLSFRIQKLNQRKWFNNYINIESASDDRLNELLMSNKNVDHVDIIKAELKKRKSISNKNTMV